MIDMFLLSALLLTIRIDDDHIVFIQLQTVCNGRHAYAVLTLSNDVKYATLFIQLLPIFNW